MFGGGNQQENFNRADRRAKELEERASSIGRGQAYDGHSRDLQEARNKAAEARREADRLRP